MGYEFLSYPRKKKGVPEIESEGSFSVLITQASLFHSLFLGASPFTYPFLFLYLNLVLLNIFLTQNQFSEDKNRSQNTYIYKNNEEEKL